jgi:UDP-N-acetylglucosamine 4,6-dehydratase
MLNNSTILVTGGTGSFGRHFIDAVFNNYNPNMIIVYSRDELKQFEMREQFPTDHFPIRYFLGDIRDKERLYRVTNGVDIIVHAAALKQVPTAESNPFEAIKTNILGSENVIEAALENDVDRVIALSTDKACNPINLYGATKLAADKLFAAANHWQNNHRTRFSVVRYGNVIGSRGSVIPFFQNQLASGCITVTDARMTRFMITLDQGIQFVLDNLERMQGGELFVPKIPSVNIIDIVNAIAPNFPTKIIGIRPGEKLHEAMISKDDAINTLEFDDYFVIQPAHPWWDNLEYSSVTGGRNVTDNFEYSSETNNQWLSSVELAALISEL